jgi:hypothetical protein
MRLVDEIMLCVLVIMFCEGEGRSQQQACDEVCMGMCSMGGPKGVGCLDRGTAVRRGILGVGEL